MVSASRVLAEVAILLRGDFKDWRVALAEDDNFREAADGRVIGSVRFGPTSSTSASLDTVAKSEIVSPS